MQSNATDLLVTLARIEHKVDEISARQEMIEDLYDEMVPVVREVMRTASQRLAAYEARGAFERGAALLRLIDAAMDEVSAADIDGFAANLGNLMDTVRNVTQPDVLAVANDATDVLHHAADVSPVGVFGVARASADPDIQKGLGIALSVLRQLGRARGGVSSPAPRASRPSLPAASEVPRAIAAAVAPPAAVETVAWEGRAFTADGFLVDAAAWDEPLAEKMAESLGLSLTDAHWVAIRWARADYLATGSSPNVRRVATGSGLGTKALYELFPRTPGKTNAMLAGIPKPAGCV